MVIASFQFCISKIADEHIQLMQIKHFVCILNVDSSSKVFVFESVNIEKKMWEKTGRLILKPKIVKQGLPLNIDRGYNEEKCWRKLW